MLVNKGLRESLYEYAERYKVVKREVLRNYGKRLKTVKNPYGYDEDCINRRIRELQQSGELVGLNHDKAVARGNEYIVYFQCNEPG